MYDYLIVGAGLYGSVAARELTDRGYSVLVIDSRSHIAGNAYTSNENGIVVHEYGAHIFHTSDEKVWNYVCRFAEFNDYINSPIAVFEGKKYNLPFNMNTFRQLWGVTMPEEAKAKIESQRVEPPCGEPRNLEEQALSMVGTDVYRVLVKGYTEKQWGRDCRDLPASIIKRLPLRFTFDNNYFNDKYQGIPKGGYTTMVERMLEGIEVRLNTDYFDLRRESRDICCGIAHKVIFTGQIDAFFDYCYGPLEYRTLRFEKDYPQEEEFQGCAVMNYTEREVPFTRIIEHKFFDYEGQKNTIITREYPATWAKGDEPYYPINNEANTSLYARYRDKAEELKDCLIFGGRLGEYKYYDMDKVIAAALKLTENL